MRVIMCCLLYYNLTARLDEIARAVRYLVNLQREIEHLRSGLQGSDRATHFGSLSEGKVELIVVRRGFVLQLADLAHVSRTHLAQTVRHNKISEKVMIRFMLIVDTCQSLTYTESSRASPKKYTS